MCLFSGMLLLPLCLHAQKIDNTVSFRDIKKDTYFRIHYDNDFFTATDIYYTQGYTIEVVSPWLRHNPVNYILPSLNKNEDRYGLAFEQTGFIPTSITDDQIRFGDRPYAATIALKSFKISTDTLAKSRLSTSLTLGMIGPAAFGDEMQTGIHKLIDDDLPQGWQYQVKNDVIFDYEAAYEFQLVRVKNYVAVTSASKVRLGTLNTHLATGFTVTAGIINSPFTSYRNRNNFQVYLYAHPVATLIGYDATLQGGLLNQNSVYAIPASDINRVTLQNNFGLILHYRSLFFEFSRSLTTREFRQGHSHAWGGFKLGFKL